MGKGKMKQKTLSCLQKLKIEWEEHNLKELREGKGCGIQVVKFGWKRNMVRNCGGVLRYGSKKRVYCNKCKELIK